MKRLLMIAYHFPPLAGSSGIQRTLRFVQHLPEYGWDPIVITTEPHAYERTSDDLLSDVPEHTVVKRTFALDAARHLSIAGRYPSRLARPDRWITWKYSAIPAGLQLIRKFKPSAIWSTYPIATAHVIAKSLQQHTGLPWIADFRDPMAQDGYPEDPKTLRRFKEIEEGAISNARFSTMTTPGAVRLYCSRYPKHAQRIVLLENGFDESSFAQLSNISGRDSPLNPGAITLVHSGIVYPSERDPTHFFAALQQLAVAGRIHRDTFRVRLRGAVHEDMLRQLVERFELRGFIEILPPLSYRDALREMLQADGLLVLQAASCNEQIPAKIYEYLRCRRPILGLTDHSGDTAAVLRNAGIDTIAALDSPDEIRDALGRFVDAIAENRAPLPAESAVRGASRRYRAESLAQLLECSLQQDSPRKNNIHADPVRQVPS